MQSVKCPQCGLVQWSTEATCKRCQAPLSAASPAPARFTVSNTANLISCPACGAQASNQAASCPHCGQPLKKLRDEKRSAISRAVLLGIVMGVALIGWMFYNAAADQRPVEQSGGSTAVTYEVSGTASRVGLTYSNAQGGTEQIEVSLPWKKGFTIEGKTALYISAQNQGEHGSVRTRIMAGSQVIKESSSDGAYKIASASVLCCQ